MNVPTFATRTASSPATRPGVDPTASTTTATTAAPAVKAGAAEKPAAVRAAIARSLRQARWASPLGMVTITASATGLTGLWFDAQRHHPGPLALPHADDDRWLAQARDELSAYFAGEVRRFAVPLDLHGTPFQRAVWQALLAVEAGATLTYGEIASVVGAPTAVRAVGAAVGRNPVSIIVPCHRIVGHGGALTGYAGGLDRKAALLGLESARRDLQAT